MMEKTNMIMKTCLPKKLPLSATCCMCLKPISDAHECSKCRRNIHRFYKLANKDERDDEMDNLDLVCFKTANSAQVKLILNSILKTQAKRKNYELQQENSSSFFGSYRPSSCF